MRILFAFVSLLVGVAEPVAAQQEYPYMDRARAQLARAAAPIGQWQVTHVHNQTVMQCTSCRHIVTVVLRYLEGYSDDTGFASARALYMAGRAAHCQSLVSSGAGRCTQTDVTDLSVLARSVEDGKEVLEFVIPTGRHLLAGYVEGHVEAEELAATQDAMRAAVDSLSPLW